MSRILGLQRLSVAQDDPTALVDSKYSYYCGEMEPSEISIHCNDTGDN